MRMTRAASSSAAPAMVRRLTSASAVSRSITCSGCMAHSTLRPGVQRGADLGPVVQLVRGHVDDEVRLAPRRPQRSRGKRPPRGQHDLVRVGPERMRRPHARRRISGVPRGVGDAQAQLAGLQPAHPELAAEQVHQLDRHRMAGEGPPIGHAVPLNAPAASPQTGGDGTPRAGSSLRGQVLRGQSCAGSPPELRSAAAAEGLGRAGDRVHRAHVVLEAAVVAAEALLLPLLPRLDAASQRDGCEDAHHGGGAPGVAARAAGRLHCHSHLQTQAPPRGRQAVNATAQGSRASCNGWCNQTCGWSSGGRKGCNYTQRPMPCRAPASVGHRDPNEARPPAAWSG